MDPVTLGLCTQMDLDIEVHRAAKEKPAVPDSGVTLLPADVTTAKDAEGTSRPRMPAPARAPNSTSRRCMPS